MIVNARMYSVTPELADLWDSLLRVLVARSGVSAEVFRHAPPTPIDELWERPDIAAALMCGLPFARTAAPRPVPLAAIVPSPTRYGGKPCYMSDIVVARDGPLHTVEDVYGKRLGLTVPGSQSGCYAGLEFLGGAARFSGIVGPLISPRGAVTAVAEGRADVAPIDAFALDLMAAHAPALVAGVRVIATTPARPSPLFVASAGTDPGVVAALRKALVEAHELNASAELMRTLLVERFADVDEASYAELAQRARIMDALPLPVWEGMGASSSLSP